MVGSNNLNMRRGAVGASFIFHINCDNNTSGGIKWLRLFANSVEQMSM